MERSKTRHDRLSSLLPDGQVIVRFGDTDVVLTKTNDTLGGYTPSTSYFICHS